MSALARLRLLAAIVLKATLAAAAQRDWSRRNWCTNSTLARSMPANALLLEKSQYWRSGYLVVRNMFSADEMAVVKQVVMRTQAMNQRVDTLRKLQEAGEHPSFTTIFVWNDVDGDDIFAKVGKSHKILDRLSCFFEDDVYDYHNKIALKYPGIAGFRPHQDHNYWRRYGAALPETSAVFIAIDPATRQNGCLEIVERSHLLGTVKHSVWSQHNGSWLDSTDLGVERQEWERLQAMGYALKPIPLAPGDAILFTGNTIHASKDNDSNESRISMIATMNTRRNSPDPALNVPGHPYWSHQRRVYSRILQEDEGLPLPDFGKKFPFGAQFARGGGGGGGGGGTAKRKSLPAERARPSAARGHRPGKGKQKGAV